MAGDIDPVMPLYGFSENKSYSRTIIKFTALASLIMWVITPKQHYCPCIHRHLLVTPLSSRCLNPPVLARILPVSLYAIFTLHSAYKQ